MTDALKNQVHEWRKGCQAVDDLVKNCPDPSDLALMLDWFNHIHPWAVYLATETARAEAYYSIKYAEILELGVPESVIKAAKGSSTITDRYISGKIPELYEVWQRLKNMAKVLDTILSDIRTNMVSLREAGKIEAMHAPSQR